MDKQIEEMARFIFDFDEVENNEIKIAKWLYDNGCHIINENEAVISKEEKRKLLKGMYEQGKFDALADLEKDGKVVISKEEYKRLKKQLKEMEKQRDEQAYITEDLIQEKHMWTEQARKEMVEEILKLAEEYNKGFISDFDNFIETLKEKYGVEIGEEKC